MNCHGCDTFHLNKIYFFTETRNINYFKGLRKINVHSFLQTGHCNLAHSDPEKHPETVF